MVFISRCAGKDVFMFLAVFVPGLFIGVNDSASCLGVSVEVLIIGCLAPL